MDFLVSNWYMIVAALAAVATLVIVFIKFIRKPSGQQIAGVRAFLLSAVIEAEKVMGGGGTGEVKLSMVYGAFVSKFPWIAMIMPFSRFSTLVDDALVRMRMLLEGNEKVRHYVYGE